MLEVTPALINRAMAVAETHGVRAYDAVQLAAAELIAAATRSVGATLTFVSADIELNGSLLAWRKAGEPVET